MPEITLAGGFTTADPRLDRLPEKDPASLDFPVMRRLAAPPQKAKSRTWKCDTYLDQGQEGACTGFSRAHNLAAQPQAVPADQALAERLYQRARFLDDYPGENYEGSSVLGAVKAAEEAGLVIEYHWAFTLGDFVLGLGYVGPAVVGIDWYNGMFTPDANGFIHPTGGIGGGHAIMIKAIKIVKGNDSLPVTGGPDVTGIDVAKSYVTYHNSWGKSWGVGGCAKQYLNEFDTLRQAQAEVCFSHDKKP